MLLFNLLFSTKVLFLENKFLLHWILRGFWEFQQCLWVIVREVREYNVSVKLYFLGMLMSTDFHSAHRPYASMKYHPGGDQFYYLI